MTDVAHASGSPEGAEAPPSSAASSSGTARGGSAGRQGTEPAPADGEGPGGLPAAGRAAGEPGIAFPVHIPMAAVCLLPPLQPSPCLMWLLELAARVPHRARGAPPAQGAASSPYTPHRTATTISPRATRLAWSLGTRGWMPAGLAWRSPRRWSACRRACTAPITWWGQASFLAEEQGGDLSRGSALAFGEQESVAR